MITSLLVAILIIISGGSWQSQSTDVELGGGPDSEGSKSVSKEELSVVSAKVSLKEFPNYPILKEEADPQPPLVWTHHAVVIDADTDKILYKKDERNKVPIASLTKMMTALIISEKISDWKEEVKVSKKAAFSGGAGIKLKWDEVITADSLFKAMLMNSDNAAAIALAEHVAGSTDKFGEMMNEKAKEIGVLDTHFTEPSGLEDEIAYSTAYDLARIARHALDQEKIVQTMQTKGPIAVDSCDGLLSHRVGNTNLFLKNENLAPRVIGSKTGFTYKAGYCLMSAMYDKKKDKKVIGVILNSGEQMRWEEMKEMIEWSFDNYNWPK